jgi:hypothetical protein
MPIVGGPPEAGLRITLERPRVGGPPWRYAGTLEEAGASWSCEAIVDERGEVTVRVAESAPASAAERVRLIVRSAHKNAGGNATPPPRKIVRWRGEK